MVPARGLQKMHAVEYLNPRRKLIEEVVDWLCSRIRIDLGATRSLGHVMVVVPTSQSGRNLRLALAKRAAANGWGGILPPRIVLPMHVIEPADTTLRTASPVQVSAAFLKFFAEQGVAARPPDARWPHLFQKDSLSDIRAQLSFLDQLGDIWRILAGNGLLMRDVCMEERAVKVLESALGDEHERWNELVEFEAAFFGFLHARGLRHESESIRAAKMSARPLPQEIDEVVLPALVDPVSVLYDVLDGQREALRVTVLIHADLSDAEKFDTWGRPRIECWTGRNRPVLPTLRDEDIVSASADTDLAKIVARDFPPAGTAAALPSLGLCDGEFFHELSAAFLNIGYTLYNPERHRVAVSSLGRILANLIDLYVARGKEYPWKSFTLLLREDDILRALVKGQEGASRRNVLEGIDICRNTFLPSVVPEGCSFDESQLRRYEQIAYGDFAVAARAFLAMIAQSLEGVTSVAAFLRRMLQAIYAGRRLTGGEDAKEFMAAACAVREVLSQFDDDSVRELSLPECVQAGLLRKVLSEASYSLEPDSRLAVKTEGWLELAWSDADNVALVAFNEGAVPDSVTGHAFLPDSLRAALSLTSNAQRLSRDTYLLKSLLEARECLPGAVRAYVARTSNVGDIHRPSRLLFLVPDSELAMRARALFGELPTGGVRPPRAIAPNWRLRLPSEIGLPSRDRARERRTWRRRFRHAHP